MALPESQLNYINTFQLDYVTGLPDHVETNLDEQDNGTRLLEDFSRSLALVKTGLIDHQTQTNLAYQLLTGSPNVRRGAHMAYGRLLLEFPVLAEKVNVALTVYQAQLLVNF